MTIGNVISESSYNRIIQSTENWWRKNFKIRLLYIELNSKHLQEGEIKILAYLQKRHAAWKYRIMSYVKNDKQESCVHGNLPPIQNSYLKGPPIIYCHAQSYGFVGSSILKGHFCLAKELKVRLIVLVDCTSFQCPLLWSINLIP